MSAVLSHVEQISTSAKSIADLHFPPPKIFTNALLYNREITALIRDTEPHERALFSIDPSVGKSSKHGEQKPIAETNRRRTMFADQQRQSSAVARVLGNDMLRKIQQSSRDGSRGRGVNVEILLQGAERLCSAFDVAGTTERVDQLRSRYEALTTSISNYEDKLVQQQTKQATLSSREEVVEEDQLGAAQVDPVSITPEDLMAEEEAVRELEARKRALEERVAGMEKDLGGLLR